MRLIRPEPPKYLVTAEQIKSAHDEAWIGMASWSPDLFEDKLKKYHKLNTQDTNQVDQEEPQAVS